MFNRHRTAYAARIAADRKTLTSRVFKDGRLLKYGVKKEFFWWKVIERG